MRRAAATFVTGEEVGDIFRDGKAYDVNVWSTARGRATASPRSSNSRIDTPDGGVVRLHEVADVEISPRPSSIHRQEVSRYIEVGANVEGRDLGSVAEEIEDGLEDMEMPLGYHAEVSGEYNERKEADRRLLFYGGLAAIGIFFLLLTSFRSARLALLSFFTLPMALVGGVLAAFVFGDGIISLGFDRRVLHHPGHRGPQRDHADQPLPATSRSRRGGVRSGAGDPRREGAPGADPHDGADDGPGPCAAADRR